MFEDYFALQLKFAAHYAAAADVPYDKAIAHCTNLRRRMNLQGGDGELLWNDFLSQARQLEQQPSAVLALALRLYESRPAQEVVENRSFGCFSYDPPNAAGVVRIHFVPAEALSASPLAQAHQAERMDELRALFEHIRRVEHDGRYVQGVSWLYNLESYKRLFPPAYIASIEVPRFAVHLNGSSTWGQVLNWRQGVKPEIRDLLLDRLAHMQTSEPWKVFPFRALVASCEIPHFYRHFL